MNLSRNKLLWVALVCAAPLVLGTAAYLLRWSPATPSNYGELLTPIPVAGLEALRGKWVLVMFAAAECDARCEQKLYYMRQVRRAQGKDMSRVERLWVITDGAKPREEILPGIEGTRLAALSEKEFPGKAVDHIYLVDPLGNLMMRHAPSAGLSKDLLEDLRKLLKLSHIG